jgi:hypothetical protein
MCNLLHVCGPHHRQLHREGPFTPTPAAASVPPTPTGRHQTSETPVNRRSPTGPRSHSPPMPPTNTAAAHPSPATHSTYSSPTSSRPNPSRLGAGVRQARRHAVPPLP